MNKAPSVYLDKIEQQLYQAMGLNPNNPAAHNTFGIVQAKAKLLDKAVLAFCRAIQLNPNYAEAYNNLGLVLKDTHGTAEAEACLRRALELDPDYADAYNNLGIVLKEADRLAEAETCFQQAIKRKPNYSEVYHNLGNLMKNANRLPEAEAAYGKAIQLAPSFSIDTRISLGTLYLLQGNYEKGWENYELRYKVLENFRPAMPRWQGEDLSKCKILLYFDQGFGDTLQFIRFADEVAAVAEHTVVWVQKVLAKLLAASQNKFTLHTGTTPPAEPFDFACPLLSLPLVLHTTQATLPRTVPYIRSTPNMIAKWRNKLAARCSSDALYKVGVVWAGNPKHDNDRHRSISFDLFSELFAISQIQWISLQVGNQADAASTLPDNVLNLSKELVDFAETAGVITNLDFIITVDSAVAHLAGALGKPTWLLLPFAPDWRWGPTGEVSLWYPTLRLFRQSKLNDWAEVLERVKNALTEKIQ